MRMRQGIDEIVPYEAGESGIDGRTDIVKLSSNENPFGPGPRARKALQSALEGAERYPPSDHAELRRAIAEIHGIDAERIVCGAGSDEVLAMLARAHAGPGREVIHTRHGFLMYRILAQAVGATPVAVAEAERRADVDAILGRCGPETALIYIANPSNPTGTMLGAAELARLADGIPPEALLVLDGAYAEYVSDREAMSFAIAEDRPNVVMTRTFSKIHGLASLRLGYGYGPRPVIDILNRIREPFNVSGPAQSVGAAAVRDTEFVESCRARNAEWRDWLRGELLKCGVQCDPSEANFLLARFANPEEAAACDRWLRNAGILVRRMDGYKLPECLRITVGDEAACRLVADGVREFRHSAERAP